MESRPLPPPPPPRRRRGMWALLAVVLLAALVAGVLVLDGRTITGRPRHGHPGPRWHQVWHDEFAGSTVDPSRWHVRDGTWASNEQSIDTARPENVAVRDGHLIITARREQYTAAGVTRQYTSGYLDTIDLGSWHYGRFAVRAKLPTSQALWPAFWLRADHGPGEIDVLEAVGGTPILVSQTVHESTTGHARKAGHEGSLPPDAATAWHTYAVQVSRGSLTWFLDGKRVFTVTAAQYPWITSAFAGGLNIRLNLQVGGDMPHYYGRAVGPDTVFPARFVVDWVRVYQYG